MPALFCEEIDQANLTNRDDLTIKNIANNFKSLLHNMVLIFKNMTFVRLCGATFLVFNGFQMVASFSYFIIVFYMFQGDYGGAGTWPAWFSTISALCTAFLIIPVITWMSNKWGKRNAFIISTDYFHGRIRPEMVGLQSRQPLADLHAGSPDGFWNRRLVHPDDEHDGRRLRSG
jgi:glycoside/pentoside/hexuronide:cation symporter, GPH family